MMSINTYRCFWLVWCSLLAMVGGAILLPVSVGAVTDGEIIEQEFTYAQALLGMGVPDYAVMAAERIVTQHPELKDRANVVRAEALIGARRMAEAEVLLRQMPADSPKTYAVQLALADGYYQLGKPDLSAELYQRFFKRYEGKIPEDPDLRRFYSEAANKFAQMLNKEGDLRAAAAIYGLLIQVLDEPDMLRQVRLEQSEILLRAARLSPGAKDVSALLAQAETNCNAVIWGGMDLWFGRAVTCLAELQLQRGSRDDAMRTLSGNLKMLKKLDEALEQADIPLSESPYAGARSLLGQLHVQEADLLLGPAVDREAEALRNYAQAVDEAEQVWALLIKVHKRDQSLANRAEVAKHMVYGTPDERQQPIRDMRVLLAEFEPLLQAGADGAWTANSAAALGALKARVAALQSALAAFSANDGVTPSPELALGATFEGRRHIQRGSGLLAADALRHEQAVKQSMSALRQFYNVFAGYPGCHWSEDASKQVTQLKDRLKALTGKEVTIKTSSGGQKRIGLVHMSEGHDLLARKQYAKASEAYLKGLNAYPDGDESVVALVGLLESHAGLEDSLWVEMVARYLAERFAGHAQAAQGLLRMGRHYFEKENRGIYTLLYELYLDHFPEHASAPTILYMLGEQRWKVKDYPGAVVYYERLTSRYPQCGYYLKALNRMAWSQYLGGDFAAAAVGFQTVIEQAPEGKVRAEAKLCLADSRRQQKRFADAVRDYHELTQWLQEKNTVYTFAEQRDTFRVILEQSIFFKAYCLGRLEKPADRVSVYRKAAVKLYEGFVKQFPDSSLAPTALSSMGALLLAEGASDKASAAYVRLATEYPKSDAGRGAKFAMVRSLIDVGQVLKAEVLASGMLKESPRPPATDLVKIGLLLYDKGRVAIAVEALQAGHGSLDAEAQPELDQRALLGLGAAYCDTGEYEKAVTCLDRLIQGYPKSGFFYRARFLLGRAYRLLGRTTEATQVLREVFERASDPYLISEATVELARVQAASGETADALASCQRIVLLSDPDDPGGRAAYEEALALSVALLVDGEQWEAAAQAVDQYLTRFKSGRNSAAVLKLRTTIRINRSTDSEQEVDSL